MKLRPPTWLLGMGLCLAASFASFFVFTYPELTIPALEGQITILTLFALLTELIGCYFGGILLARYRRGDGRRYKLGKERMPYFRCFFGRYSSLLLLLFVLFCVYLFVPKIYWNLSDLIIGARQMYAQNTLYNVSNLQQFLVENVVSRYAVFSYMLCGVSYLWEKGKPAFFQDSYRKYY